MNEPTVTKMKQMKLCGMYHAFKTAIESGKTDHYTLDEFISMLIDAEWDERHNRRIERSIKNARYMAAFFRQFKIRVLILTSRKNNEKIKIYGGPDFKGAPDPARG